MDNKQNTDTYCKVSLEYTSKIVGQVHSNIQNRIHQHMYNRKFPRPLFTIILKPKIAHNFRYRFHFEGKNDGCITAIFCV